MRSQTARSRYGLRVVDPSNAEQGKATRNAVVAGVVGLAVGGWGPTDPAKVEVQIVELRTGRVLFRQRVDAIPARKIAEEIAADLDQFDADTFAEEWSLGNEVGARDEYTLRRVIGQRLRTSRGTRWMFRAER